jgi:hypothetical protein
MKLSEDNVAMQAHRLLEGVGDEGISFLSAVEKYLAIVAAPGISWRTESLDTGLLRGLLGRRRDCLMVSHTSFTEHQIGIMARPFGSMLQVSWFLVGTPRIAREVMRSMRLTDDARTRHAIGADLDFFAMLDLGAWIDATKLCFHKAIAELTGDDEMGENNIGSGHEGSSE